ncbi:4-(cytidine 5'-diphospho)-2-C-methyl-D-erythritol kinase [Desulfovibrio sp. OttesenSCG-928-C06]|nr:4-(cytidine 5'-diphospho)-2-C-methyl-D-erythritol kinase [Desulfovibrio sp. OttesenSCG-928-C06]
MPRPELSAANNGNKIRLSQPETIHSGCKINLYLEITGVLPNGYHSISSLMLPLCSPFDSMRITQGSAPGITVQAAGFIDPQNNTLKKAYDLYSASYFAKMAVDAKSSGHTSPESQSSPAELSGQNGLCLPDLNVELTKGVPHGAGLGGGSADAAALLLFLERCLEQNGMQPLGREALMEIAAKVGADVPFFILGKTAWAEGIGEKLTPVETPLSGMYLVLVCPDIKVSTPWAYAAFDEMHPTSTRILTSSGLQATNLPSADFGLQNLFNSFEEVVFAKHPELLTIKQKLLEHGAGGALMSGSGSSLFGIFSREDKAHDAAAAMKKSGLATFVQAIIAGASPSW